MSSNYIWFFCFFISFIQFFAVSSGVPTSHLPGGQAALRRWFRRSIRRDFEAGCIVELEGWILARTEARLCGLVTTSRPRA